MVQSVRRKAPTLANGKKTRQFGEAEARKFLELLLQCKRFVRQRPKGCRTRPMTFDQPRFAVEVQHLDEATHGRSGTEIAFFARGKEKREITRIRWQETLAEAVNGHVGNDDVKRVVALQDLPHRSAEDESLLRLLGHLNRKRVLALV